MPHSHTPLVVINATAYDGRPSGTRLRAACLAAALLEADARVSVVSADGQSLAEAVRDQLGHDLPSSWSECHLPVEQGRQVARAIRLRRLLEPVVPPEAVFITDYYPVLRSVPTIVTIHDLRYRRQRTLWSFLRSAALRYQQRKIGSRNAAIFVDSGAIKREVIQCYHFDPKRVTVSYCAVSRLFREASPPDFPGTHLLAVGLSDPRKKADMLLAAYSLANAEGSPLPLVIVGRINRDLQRLIDKCRKEVGDDMVRTTGIVSEEALVELYRRAAVLLHPSEYEGFGIPVLEASAIGVPVIAAPDPAVREIAPPLTRYLPAGDIFAWAREINHASDQAELDPVRRRELRQWARRFTWAHVARQILDEVSHRTTMD